MAAGAPSDPPADEGAKPPADGAVRGFLADILKQAPAVLLTASAFLGFVALVGGVTVWGRFYAAELPAEQAVNFLPRSELIVIGTVSLLLYGVLGLLAAFVSYLVDDGGRARERILYTLLALAVVESAVVFTIVYREEKEAEHITDAVFVVVYLFALAFLVARRFRSEQELLPRTERDRRKEAAGEPAPRPRRYTLHPVAFVVLVLLAIAVAVVTWQLLELLWVSIALLVAMLLAVSNYRVADLTDGRFVWYGVAVFFSVPLFGAILALARLIDEPQAQPAALIRVADKGTEGLQGLYVTETESRIYLASVAVSGCGGDEVRGGSGRLFSVPRAQVAELSVGSLQDVADAAIEAPEMLRDLIAIRIPPKVSGPASKSPPRPITVGPAVRQDVTFKSAPAAAPTGEKVKITGQGFGKRTGSVVIGGARTRVEQWTETRIVAVVPTNAQSGRVRVQCPQGLPARVIRIQQRPRAVASAVRVPGTRLIRLNGNRSRDRDGRIVRHVWSARIDDLRVNDKLKRLRLGERREVTYRFPRREHPYRLVVELEVTDDEKLTSRDRLTLVHLPAPVLFCPDCRVLSRRGTEIIRRIARFVGPRSALQIDGHTDSRASSPYNKELARDRACAVLRALSRELGLGIDRVVVRSFGESSPVASNATPDGRQRNRRVEIQIDEREDFRRPIGVPVPSRCGR